MTHSVFEELTVKRTLTFAIAMALAFATNSFAQTTEQAPAAKQMTPQQQPMTQQTMTQQPVAHQQATQLPSAQMQGKTGQVPATQASATPMMLSFQLADWKTVHAKDETHAQQTVDTLAGLGIECTKHSHEDHFDVRFRCPGWKTIKVDTSQQLDQWQQYLDMIGLDTVALNPPAQTPKPTVSFRLAQARTAHLDDRTHAEALNETFRMLGCQVSLNDHNGHVDLNLSCDEWKTIALRSEDAAHVWQDWLKQNGFETKHVHK